MITRLLVTLGTICCAVSCGKQSAIPSAPSSVDRSTVVLRADVEMLGLSDAVIAMGSVTLLAGGDGTWLIFPVGEPPDLPLGSGALDWRALDDGSKSIDLQPDIFDSNIILSIPGAGDAAWEYHTYGGVTMSGALRVEQIEVR